MSDAPGPGYWQASDGNSYRHNTARHPRPAHPRLAGPEPHFRRSSSSSTSLICTPAGLALMYAGAKWSSSAKVWLTVGACIWMLFGIAAFSTPTTRKVETIDKVAVTSTITLATTTAAPTTTPRAADDHGRARHHRPAGHRIRPATHRTTHRPPNRTGTHRATNHRPATTSTSTDTSPNHRAPTTAPDPGPHHRRRVLRKLRGR